MKQNSQKSERKRYTKDKKKRVLIRMNPELYDFVMKHGGSPWVRDLIQEARDKSQFTG